MTEMSLAKLSADVMQQPLDVEVGALVFLRVHHADAAIAVLLAVGLTRNPEPKDTFDDPYLAYAEVEKVFSKISGTVAYGADKISESEATLDKYSYWK